MYPPPTLGLGVLICTYLHGDTSSPKAKGVSSSNPNQEMRLRQFINKQNNQLTQHSLIHVVQNVTRKCSIV